MSDISIQFHAHPTEVLSFVRQCASEFGLHVAAMQYRPFHVVEALPHDLASLFVTLPEHNRLALTIDHPDVEVSNELEFQRRNPDHLRIDIGRITDDGLEESWLCARTDNTDVLRKWRRIAKRLETITHSGVTAVNRTTGATATYKSARYSDGARELEKAGVPMLPAQGPRGPILKLGI